MIEPMLAKSKTVPPFSDPDYIFETKWDGERAIASVEGGKIVRLQSRSGNDISSQFPELIGQPVIAESAILDGEIVVFNGGDVPSFKKLSERAHTQDTLKIKLRAQAFPATYVVFDILMAGATDTRQTPLQTRKDILATCVPQKDERLMQSTFVWNDGETLFNTVVGQGHEGVVAKLLSGTYREGKRVWLKIKPDRKATCVIIGYSKGQGARENMGRIYIAEEVNGQLVERGKVGSGFTQRAISELLGMFKETGRAPGQAGEEIILVQPDIKIQVKFFEQTEAGHYRHPVFRGRVS